MGIEPKCTPYDCSAFEKDDAGRKTAVRYKTYPPRYQDALQIIERKGIDDTAG